MELAKVANYDVQELLGVGKYGRVYRAWDIVRVRVVALKEIKVENEDEGIPITTLREIVLLRGIKHKNVVELIDTVIDLEKSRIFLVLEFMDWDLSVMLAKSGGLSKESQKVG
jgi:serine/threonine protein kinase